MEKNLPRAYPVSPEAGNISPQHASLTAGNADKPHSHPVDGIVTGLDSASRAHQTTLAGLSSALDSRQA